ncbi:MAG: phage BR0599 family protein [Rickettsiaceae bacterium]|nr:phage BR0599 family protein [Rickettsiaceae bacterium]
MSICFLFEIATRDGKTFFLTSSDTEKNIKDKKYYPYCGLNLLHVKANDSGDNIAVISGIYHASAIKKTDDLTDATITILQLVNNNLRIVGNLLCTFFSKQDLEFRFFCNSEIIKYKQSLLQLFSNTCRASFGDNKCKINPSDFTLKAQILEFENNRIKYQSQTYSNISFTGGQAILLGNNSAVEYSTKIISHLENIIDINLPQHIDPLIYNQLLLIPSCDKKYRTCCYSFNNQVNFRGEPHIPNINIIKN